MREIKFRAWDKKGGKWLKAGQKLLGLFVAWGSPTVFEILGRGDYEVMQYTGLKDKNGVEIYEGDLVDWNGLYEIRFGEHDVPSLEDEVVIDHATGFYFKAQHDLKNVEPFGFDLPINEGYAKECQVIGNIYEHPHLLEVDSNA